MAINQMTKEWCSSVVQLRSEGLAAVETGATKTDQDARWGGGGRESGGAPTCQEMTPSLPLPGTVLRKSRLQKRAATCLQGHAKTPCLYPDTFKDFLGFLKN
jgi:hypothetical protein